MIGTPDVKLIGALDQDFAWNGVALIDPEAWDPGAEAPASVRGPLSAVRFDDRGRCRLARDPLGLNKLFWSADPGPDVLLASRPAALVKAGRPFETIRSLPPGVVVDLDPASGTFSSRPLAHGPGARAVEPPLEDLATEIREGLDRYMAAIAEAYPGAQVFVCTSGGVDSTGVATLAAEHFHDVIAVSFDVRRCGRPGSEDRRVAQHLARDLGLFFLPATFTADEVLDGLDTVLIDGADWRDFNVHAGLVHAALARTIAEAADPTRPTLVLSGDLANELVADYSPETHGGNTYYPLPRVRPAALRHLLVQGLQTSNREIGPFSAWGLPVIQPFAAVADRFLALPEAFLSNPRRKADLGRLVFGGRIPAYVYDRPKVRAQVGDPSAGGGVLALCLDRGIDQAYLRARFAALHGLSPDAEPVLDRFIRCGRYRPGIPKLTTEAA